MKRRVGLSPGSKPLRRGKPIRAINPERAKKREARSFGAKAGWLRSLACMSCLAAPPNDCAHVRSRGAGGTSAETVPLCRRCHSLVHAVGWERATGETRDRWLIIAANLEAEWQGKAAA